tara:strand:- start:118 stop:450 length:333 start_codon:yes stop_codon:yes gene_type:complete
MGEEIIFYPRLLVRHTHNELKECMETFKRLCCEQIESEDVVAISKKINELISLIEDASKFHGYLQTDEDQINSDRSSRKGKNKEVKISDQDLLRYHGLSKQQLDFIKNKT